MEMESSRRLPFDRSREIVKKPRLSDESALPVGSGRQFHRPGSSREAGDPARGGVQQHQELVNQYKIALAELTFNSKPIITNLTIIAGENLQSARAIASTICSNILEVPSEQKLPSLYLLDSIVKNIGGDYIKYFAARLPEVFCKAYRMVDSSTHPSMRHLFGTWKGVFPPQPLQIIEKELGLSAAVNRSSSGSAASKADPQTQRQSSSIHVNPKYLEARQCLQQSNRPNGTDTGGTSVKPSNDVERPERTTTSGTGRPWVDSSLKINNIQRPVREALRVASGVPSEKLIGQESLSSQRNGLDIKRGVSSYTGVRPTSGNVPSLKSLARNGADMSRSWKNSEEEEYMWDDLGSRVTNSATLSGTKRDVWSSDDGEKMDYNPHKLSSLHTKRQSPNETGSIFERDPSPDALSFPQKDLETSTHSRLPQQKLQEPHQIDARSPLSKRDPRKNLTVKDHMRSHAVTRSDPRTAAPLSGQSFTGLRDQIKEDASRHQNSQPDLQGKSDVSTLLAAVMKSGVLSGRSASVQLALEPPSTSLLTSKTHTGSEGGIISSRPSHDSASSPVSSTSGPTSDVASTKSNPLSSLFTSLAAKGLISSSKNDSIAPIPVQSKTQHKEDTQVPVPIPPGPKAGGTDKLSGEQTATIPETRGQVSEVESDNLIGVEFKPRLLREFNQSVIDRVLENLPYKCTVCGLQFKLRERLDKHSEWHALRNSIPNSLSSPSRRWYSSSTDWIAGKAGFPFGYCSSGLTKAPSESGRDERMVPADESQCVCLLCGEVFEEVYSLERDEWMFKGAVYMSIPSVSNDGGSSHECGAQNLIVHANCMTDESVHELGSHR